VRNINRVVLHSSDSSWGCSKVIDSWHRDRGWDAIGYHYVITNGFGYSTDKYNPWLDGSIEYGRNEVKIGAHVASHNRDTLGVCIVGRGGIKGTVTDKQIFAALDLISWFMKDHNIVLDRVIGHYELDNGKRCPEIDMDFFRGMLTLNKRADIQRMIDVARQS